MNREDTMATKYPAASKPFISLAFLNAATQFLPFPKCPHQEVICHHPLWKG